MDKIDSIAAAGRPIALFDGLASLPYGMPPERSPTTSQACERKPVTFDDACFAVAPSAWKDSCANTECSLHQLAPYIGKIKSSIAGDLIEAYSRPDDLVVDPFAGAGTIPLEAALRGRRAFGADVSPYARILSQAKLGAPKNLEAALAKADAALMQVEGLPLPDLRKIPLWVRRFFNPRTLREILRFATFARLPGNEFLMACFLGILHHQRPGFLSYPSSHLVPYLRDKKYPETKFPEMYSYRELKPRLLSKVRRAYRRFDTATQINGTFRDQAVEQVDLPANFGALITSPPYMNALDYGRDNRLRLWFIDPCLPKAIDNHVTKQREAFTEAIKSLAEKVQTGLRPGGYCVFVVGEAFQRSFNAHPSQVVFATVSAKAPSLKLREIIADSIPDVRRTRRECRGVKTEHILVFQKD